MRKPLKKTSLSSLELCAGGGGQALGLEMAGFQHEALVEISANACNTLRLNRPNWNVLEQDLNNFSCAAYKGIDLLSGGLPCPPFSKAGKQLGKSDERNLFPVALDIINEIKPKAILIENVRGLLDAVFEDYREYISGKLRKNGYITDWKLFNASDFGVPQLRPRVVFVALRKDYSDFFAWPTSTFNSPPTVGEALYDLMASKGWRGAKRWKSIANEIAPTIVGGSLKHGGPDLGPTRAKRAWAAIGVDGMGIANEAPDRDFVGMPRLTVNMVARIQGFSDDWHFYGKKTPAYRQVGNAFPPPVAKAIGESVFTALNSRRLKVVA